MATRSGKSLGGTAAAKKAVKKATTKVAKKSAKKVASTRARKTPSTQDVQKTSAGAKPRKLGAMDVYKWLISSLPGKVVAGATVISASRTVYEVGTFLIDVAGTFMGFIGPHATMDRLTAKKRSQVLRAPHALDVIARELGKAPNRSALRRDPDGAAVLVRKLAKIMATTNDENLHPTLVAAISRWSLDSAVPKATRTATTKRPRI